MNIYHIFKKCLLSAIILVATAITSNAQKFTYVNGKDVTSYRGVDGEEVTASLKIRNNTSQTLEITWVLLQNDFNNENWDLISFCDPYLCHYEIPNTFTAPLYANSTSDSISAWKLGATPKNFTTKSTLRVVAWESSDPMQKDTLTFTIDATKVGIFEDKQTKNTFTTYPNPAKNTLFLDLKTKGNTFIHIFDVNGRLMFTEKLFNSQNKINTENLPVGLYILKATSETGITSVSRFQKL